MLEIARLLGMTMSQLAAANRRLIADAFMREGDTEYDVALPLRRGRRGVPAADRRDALLRPRPAPARADPPGDVFDDAELSSGRPTAADEVDGLLRRPGRLHPARRDARLDALGAVTGRLGELAASVVEPPVRLVKMIGDAAMVVGPRAGPAGRGRARAGRGGRERGGGLPAAARRGRERPGARAGRGLVRPPGQPGEPGHRDRPPGERPGHRAPSREALADAYAWSFAGERRFKGIDDRVKLYRCRRRGDRSRRALRRQG